MAKQKSTRGEKINKEDALLVAHIVARIAYLTAKDIQVSYPPDVRDGVGAFRKWAKLFLEELDDWNDGGSDI